MASKTITFKKTTTFLGRNGEFKQKGLVVAPYGDEVTLAPITSKDAIGRAWLAVPKTAIPELINILQSMI